MLVLVAALFLAAPAAIGDELSCEQNDNAEAECCCFKKAHTYEFEARRVSRLEVTFDTGRGIGCRSQVSIQVQRRDGWRTLRTVDAISSDGRSQANRLSGTFELGETISGVRIDDGGRCYIDYSTIAFDQPHGTRPPGTRPPDTRPPEFVPAPGKLASGSYRLEAYSNRRHQSKWDLEVSGRQITGTSEWDCCPGRRRDALRGTVEGGNVEIRRGCGGQGILGRCEQVYQGTVSDRGTVSGGWSHNGRFAGKWRLEPVEPLPPATPSTRIIADPAPPYREVPVTIDFAVEPAPVPGAVWWMDGRRMTNAEIFFWTYGAAGRHEIELRDESGESLTRLDLNLLQPAQRRVEIKPDKEPPFYLPASLTFRQHPRPIRGARWYVDDAYASSAQTLTREFLEPRKYHVDLRSASGEVLAALGLVVEDAGHRLWGRRQRGSSGVRNDLRELLLERSATITEIEGSAESYCIWTVAAGGAFEHRVVCGDERNPIAGAILLPGRYVVLPDLADRQRASEVTIHLRSR